MSELRTSRPPAPAHGAQLRVDVSAVPARASAVAGGRGRQMVTVTCVCGGTIRGDRLAPAAYVRSHNRSNRHRDWRALREYDDFLDRLVAEKVTRKVPA